MDAIRPFVLAAMFFMFAGAAGAHDWYQVNAADTGCGDVTTGEAAAGSPGLGSPEGSEALYQSLGGSIATTTLSDSAGASIIVQNITDSDGNPFLRVIFFPSLGDCQYFLSYQKAHAP